jgi:hypothetical protein
MMFGIPFVIWVISFIIGSILGPLAITIETPIQWLLLYLGIIFKNMIIKLVYDFRQKLSNDH